MPAQKTTKLQAVTDMSLRKSPDKNSPLYEEWFNWPAGTVFEPPPHMKVDLALARGIVVEVTDG